MCPGTLAIVAASAGTAGAGHLRSAPLIRLCHLERCILFCTGRAEQRHHRQSERAIRVRSRTGAGRGNKSERSVSSRQGQDRAGGQRHRREHRLRRECPGIGTRDQCAQFRDRLEQRRAAELRLSRRGHRLSSDRGIGERRGRTGADRRHHRSGRQPSFQRVEYRRQMESARAAALFGRLRRGQSGCDRRPVLSVRTAQAGTTT